MTERDDLLRRCADACGGLAGRVGQAALGPAWDDPAVREALCDTVRAAEDLCRDLEATLKDLARTEATPCRSIE